MNTTDPHTNFSLKSSGETIVFSEGIAGGKSKVIDSVTYPEIYSDQSYGRKPNGTGPFKKLSSASPKYGN